MKRVSRFGFGCLCLLWVFSAHASVWYVDTDAPPGGNGTSWQTAFQTIQPAIDTAIPGNEIWVATGNYPEIITLVDGVAVYGGFDGTESRRNQRDSTAHPVQILGMKAEEGMNGRCLDGVVISNDTQMAMSLNEAGNVRIANCTIENNSCGIIGINCPNLSLCAVSFLNNGSLMNQNETHSTLDLENCTARIEKCLFSGNRNYYTGGAIYLQAGSEVSIVDSTFINNKSYTAGGAIACYENSLELNNCIFSQNRAINGGAIWFNTYASDLHTYRKGNGSKQKFNITNRFEVLNCCFTDNSAFDGGAIWTNSAYYENYTTYYAHIAQCVFARNLGAAFYSISFSAVMWGDPPCDMVTEPPFIYACTFVDNPEEAIHTDVSQEIYDVEFDVRDVRIEPVRVYGSIVWDDVYTIVAERSDVRECLEGTGNICEDPHFVDAASSNYHLLPDSPCIDTGADYGFPQDLEGVSRRLDGDGLGAGTTGDGSDCDMGAYEYVPPITVCDEYHSADTDQDYHISLSELLRVIQLFNWNGFHCDSSSEDGFALGPGDTSCCAHSTDYVQVDWKIDLSELLRLIQFFNSPGYRYCPGEGSEDGFCPNVGAE